MPAQPHAKAFEETEQMLKDLEERRESMKGQDLDTLMLDAMTLTLKNQLTIMRISS